MKRVKTFLRRIFHMGDAQAILIIVGAALLVTYSTLRLEPASPLAMTADALATFALVVLVVKGREWLKRLNAALRARRPRYDRFCRAHAAAMARKGRGAKAVYVTLRALTIASGIARFLQGDYNNCALAVLTLVLFTLPDLVQDNFPVRLPSTLEAIIYCFIFAAEVLGEINNFYGLIPGWDTILHTINGFLCAAIGFALVDMLNRKSSHVQLSPLYLAITAFCFSMTVGVMWEFIEFFGDQLFPVDMQKDTLVPVVKSILINPTGANVPVILRDVSQTVIHYGGGETFTVAGGYLDLGIVDTMKDLFVNFIGAVVFSAFGYFYVKDRDADKPSFAGRFIPTVDAPAPEVEAQKNDAG